MMTPGERGSSFPIEGDLTHSHAGERYGHVVDRLLAEGGRSRQVLVTSAGEGEGKSITAVNLAFALHARRIPVLLAELSLRRPKFSEVFTPSPLPKGVEAVLEEGTRLLSTVCVRNDNQLRMAMVKRQQETDDLLAPGPRLDHLLLEARSAYEWTIFDAPSVQACSHIPSLAASVGLVLLVARARHTRKEALQEALMKIAHPHMMVLLNDSH